MSRSKKVILFLLAVIVLIVIRRVLGILSINSFLFLDNLLFLSEGVNVWLMWGLLGLLVGVVTGAWVAFRKYRLSYSAFFLPLAALVFVVAILFLVNKPAARSTTRLERKRLNANAYVTVTATNTQPDYKTTSYTPSNMLDYNDNTAWIGKTGGNQFIDFTFTSGFATMNNVQCVALRMKNGYGKSRNVYDSHNRVRSFTVFHNEERIGTYYANDYFNMWQEIAIEPVPVIEGDVLRISLENTYEGSRYEKQTAITEMIPVLEYFDN